MCPINFSFYLSNNFLAESVTGVNGVEEEEEIIVWHTRTQPLLGHILGEVALQCLGRQRTTSADRTSLATS